MQKVSFLSFLLRSVLIGILILLSVLLLRTPTPDVDEPSKITTNARKRNITTTSSTEKDPKRLQQLTNITKSYPHHRHREPRRKYNVSILLMEVNQTDYLREFVRHYLAEGVDHFFIYDTDNLGIRLLREKLLSCLSTSHNTRYFSIIPRFLDSLSSTSLIQERQRVYESIRFQTVWLMNLEVRDFIASRFFPMATLRQLLAPANVRYCQVVAVPILDYAWHDISHTQFGQVREHMQFRWGYNESYLPSSMGDDKDLSRNTAAIRKAFQKAPVRLIFRTAAVEIIESNYVLMFPKGTVCISSKKSHMSCAVTQPQTTSLTSLNMKRKQFDNNISTRPISENRIIGQQQNQLQLQQQNEQEELMSTILKKHERHCVENNQFRTRRSIAYVHLREADIPFLTLAVHRMSIPSWDAWWELSASNPSYYNQDSLRIYNRVDVYDPFLSSSTRMDYRLLPASRPSSTTSSTTSTTATNKGNPYSYAMFAKAQQVMQNCPL